MLTVIFAPFFFFILQTGVILKKWNGTPLLNFAKDQGLGTEATRLA